MLSKVDSKGIEFMFALFFSTRFRFSMNHEYLYEQIGEVDETTKHLFKIVDSYEFSQRNNLGAMNKSLLLL